jgi:hypothetical protein
MSEAEQRLATDRRNRNAARGLFDQRLARVKADLSARSIPARAKDRVQEQVFTALDQGIDVAKESKGIIAAVAAAVTLWFFRNPLIELASGLFDKDSGGNDQPSQEEQEA